MTDESFLECWFLTGPTASGKTAVGVELAKILNAEIISLDSMAVYRGMDIGTAKPTDAERRCILHHLIDIVAPNDEFSVAEYRDHAWRAVQGIWERGNEVLFVGGTPLYLTALLRGLSNGPPPDWDFRRQVGLEVQQFGSQALHDRLGQVDPLSAAKLHPHDVKRMTRALEVQRVTGQPISHLQTQFDEGRPSGECRVFKLDWPRAELYARIDNRVDRLFDNGLVDEVRGLLATYGDFSQTARQAVGYREVLDYLSGATTLEAAIEGVKTRTRRFAKHQETWFRRLSECHIFPMDTDLVPNQVAQHLAAKKGDGGLFVRSPLR